MTELLAKTFQYQLEFESINNASKACQVASEWLFANRSQLVADARDFIYKYQQVIGIELSLEQVKSFCEVIDCYLFWIGNEMAYGKEANHLPKDIPLSLPKEAYVKTFEILKEEISSNAQDLPKESVNHLRAYLTQFIIKPLSDL